MQILTLSASIDAMQHSKSLFKIIKLLLIILLNLSFDLGDVPMDWSGACIVPLYKGKGDKCECSNSRGIS